MWTLYNREKFLFLARNWYPAVQSIVLRYSHWTIKPLHYRVNWLVCFCNDTTFQRAKWEIVGYKVNDFVVFQMRCLNSIVFICTSLNGTKKTIVNKFIRIRKALYYPSVHVRKLKMTTEMSVGIADKQTEIWSWYLPHTKVELCSVPTCSGSSRPDMWYALVQPAVDGLRQCWPVCSLYVAYFAGELLRKENWSGFLRVKDVLQPL
jgi:hypothetical protein